MKAPEPEVHAQHDRQHELARRQNARDSLRMNVLGHQVRKSEFLQHRGDGQQSPKSGEVLASEVKRPASVDGVRGLRLRGGAQRRLPVWSFGLNLMNVLHPSGDLLCVMGESPSSRKLLLNRVFYASARGHLKALRA